MRRPVSVGEAIPLGRRRLSLRAVLVSIVLLVACPPLLFSGIVLLRYADSERAQAELQLEASANALARAIDAEFGAVEAVLYAMASSTRLAIDDLVGFEAQLRAVAERTRRHFELVAVDGRILISTGPDLQAAGREAAPTGPSTVFTNVLADARGEVVARVIVPVLRGGEVRWTLQGIVGAEQFRSILAQPGVPKEWIVSIVDRNGTHLIRSSASEQFAGKPLVPVLAERVRQRRSGTLPTVSLEGIPLISTVAFAPRSGWAAAIGQPAAILHQPIRDQLESLLTLGLLLAVIALGSGLLLARSLNRSMSALGDAARRIGAGERVQHRPTVLREADELGRALVRMSDELHAQSQRLIELNATLENQVVARTAQLSESNSRLLDEIARRQKSEADLRQVQKMEAVGQLTGGIAHDFNNMLAIILGSLRLMQRRLERGDARIEKYLDGAVQGAERAANLVHRLLAFARQQPLSPRPTDVNALLSGIEEVLRRTIPESINIEMVLADGLWPTLVDGHELESAIVNLAVNARDAMPGGGRMTIRTANVVLDESHAAANPEVSVGAHVVIAVTDTGQGMSADVIARAFDPFFTTKPAGTGTGLGLSLVYGFTRQSGGHVTIDSEAAVGTTVKIYLPRLAEAPDAGAAARPRLPSARVMGEQQLVLVVEDNPGVRQLTVEMVEELNYRVLQAEGGTDALRVMDANPDLQLLLTDVIMPGMNGRKLADEALRRRPGIKVLFTTGYTRDAIVHDGVLDQGVQLIVKPFTIEALSEKLAASLQAASWPTLDARAE